MIVGYAPTVVFDFDGVIHSYQSGWKGAGEIPDPVVPGIVEAIDELRAGGYRVVVVSTRCADPAGKAAVEDYLTENRIAVDGVMAEKPPALCYVDDRAICFRGNAWRLVDQIKGFKSWVEDPAAVLRGCTEVIMKDISREREEELRELLSMPGAVVIEKPNNPAGELRPCRAIRYEKGEAIEVFGRFHRWGSQYEEFENGPGNFTTALVETEDGKVYECVADGLQFLDRGPDIGERR